MPALNKILVGVDLLQIKRGEWSPPVTEAVKQAIWLAERLKGEVTFLTAIDLPKEEGDDYSLAIDRQRVVGQIEVSAQEALKKLVERAAERGVRADGKLAYGQSWIELTREAISGGHELLIVGTHNVGAVRRVLFDSTAMKLLHNCPCPVWVAKPEPYQAPANLLVASDFSDVSDEALRLALRISSSKAAQVHLIHVIERPYVWLWEAGLFEAQREELFRKRDREAAEKRLKEQVARVAGTAGSSVEVYVADDPSVADQAILKYIDAHRIDLLVLGTTARRGIAGAFLGNTAERLLTALPCSLLAVKPADFVCPAPLESARDAQPTAYL